ncbi:MAG: adenylyl-sulfate kinase [Polyangiaceae bacterium]
MSLGDDKGVALWLTGLSGAGKSTLATALEPEIRRYGRKVEILDGDQIRTHPTRRRFQQQRNHQRTL